MLPKIFAPLALLAGVTAAHAGPDLECPGSSQIEIGACVADTLSRVDDALDVALGFARNSAEELDAVTGRTVAVPALNTAQAAWTAYRDAHCDFVGATFGGGSGTGIGIDGCRIVLGRARVEDLLEYAQ